MKKTIIALKGKGKSGKSTTLRLLSNKLEIQGFKIIIDKRKINRTDFKYVVFSKNGIRVGITSYGDLLEIIKNNLKILENLNCKILICACRSRGETLNFPKYFSSYRVEFIEKSITDIVSERNKLNKSDANKIYKRIKEILK
ncbi:MAG TPA: hypothetical protein VIK14_15310 [Ignavibacteria bacterium]